MLDVVVSALCFCRLFVFICCVIPGRFGLITCCFRFVCLFVLVSGRLCVEVFVSCVAHSFLYQLRIPFFYMLSVSVVCSRIVFFIFKPHMVVL